MRTPYTPRPGAMPILAGLARALRGEIIGDEILAPGPGHSPKDRSLSVRLSQNAPDGFIVHSFSGDDWRDCHEHVRAALRLPKDAWRGPSRDFRPRKSSPKPPQAQEVARKRRALSIWAESIEPRGSLVEKYLAGRGLELPDEVADEAIRFHSACPFGANRFPAMVCLVRNLRTNEPQAIHRTALSPDGFGLLMGRRGRDASGSRNYL